MTVIYRGGHHTVECDGKIHVTQRWDPATRSMVREPVNRCFCEDPEFKRTGFTYELSDRYPLHERDAD